MVPMNSNDLLAPAGLEGVIVAETEIGDVRGAEGFYHYRQYSATELAASRSFEEIWQLLHEAKLPDGGSAEAFLRHTASLRVVPDGVASALRSISHTGEPLEVLRSAVSLLGAELGWSPILDLSRDELLAETGQLCALVPVLLAHAYRLRIGAEPIAPRADLGFAANYLWMLTGREPDPEKTRAIEQYLILVVDHGFNASTFVARTIASTGADLASCICGAIGALSGPLHGGAPSRALDMLDEIADPALAEDYVQRIVSSGGRVMGFGHRVYKTEDPRSRFLMAVAEEIGAPLLPLARKVEGTVEHTLAVLKPGRELHANVEYYAGVVMDACGIPREMFTPTFSSGRTVGWCAHVLEQSQHNRLIRPSAHYVGPSAPEAVPIRRFAAR
jgi:citrate synthase